MSDKLKPTVGKMTSVKANNFTAAIKKQKKKNSWQDL